MTRLIRFVSHLVLALAAGKALAISGAYDAGGGASIPLPAGEWVVHSDKSSDYGSSGRVVVLGPAAGQVGDVVGILASTHATMRPGEQSLGATNATRTLC